MGVLSFEFLQYSVLCCVENIWCANADLDVQTPSDRSSNPIHSRTLLTRLITLR
jgi:hypothetical protein